MISGLVRSAPGQAHDAVFVRAATYLYGRQSPNGGFCFYRAYGVEEPNLFDTYHAVAALAGIGGEVPNQQALLGFLRALASHAQVSALYYRSFTLEYLGRADHVDTAAIRRLVLASPPIAHVPLAAALEQLHQAVRLKQRFAAVDSTVAAAMATRLCALQHDGGFGDKPNLVDTAAALAALSGLGTLDRHTVVAVREFVDALQIEGLGFTLTQDSLTSSLGTILAGIESCELLGLPLRFGADIEGFVLACEAADGGFARVPGALRDIESTHHAVSILQHLRRCPPSVHTPFHDP